MRPIRSMSEFPELRSVKLSLAVALLFTLSGRLLFADDAVRGPEPATLRIESLASVASLGTDAGGRWKILPADFATPGAEAPPGRVVQTPGDLFLQGFKLNEISGTRSVWYRLEFELETAPDRTMALRLGQISDRDRTYINGVLIGETGRWDAVRAQAYDQVRVYEIPASFLRSGRNVLDVRVQAYFDEEYGIYRDRIELGPTGAIWQDYYLENTYQAFALIAYLTFALYFLLFFLRRRSDRENLLFALFLLSLVTYSFLATQFKYILGYELYTLKKVQTISLFTSVPLFYLFIRSYYDVPPRVARYWDRAAYLVHLVPLVGIGIVLFSESTEVWQETVDSLVQPGWLPYVGAVLFILVRQAARGNRDAWIMLFSAVLLVIALVLDILTGRAFINLPPLLTYGFVLFVISMALVLANRFVRLHDETEDLNQRLVEFNAASRRFVPFELLEMLDRGSIVDVTLGDQVQKEMTVLFSDIRSFTRLSEQMTPQENFAFINSYLRRMGPVIRNHRGFIDKYIGDAIMALFPESADDAFAAALEMQTSLVEWNESRRKHGLQAVQIGVGINHGRLMLGTIGENERMEGTVISDAVNLASRIEGLTRMYGAAVLTGDATLAALRNPDRFHFRRLDRVRVKGKKEIIDLYELLDALPDSARASRDRTRADFDRGLEFYLAGDFAAAGAAFTAVANQDSADLVAQLYIQRCRKLAQAGDQLEWDGTTTLKSK